MHFVIKEKVLIVSLFHLGVNLNRIAKIISSFRRNDSLNEIIIHFAANESIRRCLESFKYEFDPDRNKPTNRPAVKKVVDKWVSASMIENYKRKNYHKAISPARILNLCDFVSSSNKNRKLTLRQLKTALSLPCGLSTICNYLRANDLGCFVQRKKMLLNDDHKFKRLLFALTYYDLPPDFWMNVIFTDEKSVQNFNNGKTLIRRPKRTHRAAEYATVCDKSGRFRVNLWGFVCSKGFAIFKIGTLNESEYLKVLRNCAFPNFRDIYPEGDHFMIQDNCQTHKTPLVMDYLEDNNVKLLPFPPRAPEVNVIEHVWNVLQKNVNK